ncbi:MAG: hypothetical protein H7Y13_02285 [Sphingobacteriaceae bacterium]|nr:hypothetical protein [Sphingobacteriaceae bacterium]
MKNTGTLIGATIRAADSEDSYPVAFQNEIKGGHHSKSSVTAMEAIPAHLREPGMTCFVTANGFTYGLGNDLITWTLKTTPTTGGGGTDPDTGEDITTITIISGNFGAWIDLPAKSASIYDEVFPIRYKADLGDFPARAIVYLVGQFALNSAFVGTEITLGTLPDNTRPAARLKKYLIVKNIEMFLVIDTNGDVKLISKDGFNLPVTEALAPDTHEEQPYYIDIFYKPLVVIPEPDTFTATRSGNFTRNNCGVGSSGSVVAFEKEYTSTVSQNDADNQAANDPDFNTDGQAYANANGICTVNPPASYTATRSGNFTRNNCAVGSSGSVVAFEKEYTSTVSLDDAYALADSDPDFNSDGQAYANANGVCTVNTTTYQLTMNNASGAAVDVSVTDETNSNLLYSGLVVTSGNVGPFDLNDVVDDGGFFSVYVGNPAAFDIAAFGYIITTGSSYVFTGLTKDNLHIDFTAV